MRRAVIVVAAALLALLLTAAPVAAGDVGDTWSKRIERAPEGVTGPLPVVLWVHGCNGLGPGPGALYPDTQAWVQTITQAGWKFVAPDSWARGTWSRPNLCPDGVNSGRSGSRSRRPALDDVLRVWGMRIEEIAYTVARLQEDPAVDQSRLVVFGHSEGGMTVATSPPPPGVRALIVSGWTCHGAIPRGTGLAAPPSMPLLALEFETDSYLWVQGRCSEFFPGRTDARELIISGAGHQTGGVEAARAAVIEFLGSLR